MTSGSFDTLAITDWTAAWLAWSFSEPRLAWNTIWDVSPACWGKRLAEEVEGTLGLGPGEREVVDVAGAGTGGERACGDDQRDPEGGDEAAAVVGEGGKASHDAGQESTACAEMQ